MDIVTYSLARAYADKLSSGEPAEMRRSGDWIEWRRVGELEWHQLVPLVDIAGPQGLQGIQGEKGEKGDTGAGLSVLGSFDDPSELPADNNEVGDAYLISQHLWVWDGDEWVDTGTIQGPKGETGKSAYQEAVDNGFEGDVEDWLLSLKGEKGDTGEQGPTGAGVPAGGVTGQAVVKASEDDYDTEWSDVIPSRLGPVSPTVDLDNVSESGWSSDGTSAVETIVFDSGRTQTRYGENGLIESRTHDGAGWTEWVRASGTDIQAGDGISVTGDESEPVVSVDDSVMRLDRAETVTGEKTVTTIKVTNSGSIAPSSDNGSFTVGSSASTRPNVQLSGPNNRGQLRVGTTVAATWTNTGLHAGDSNAPGDLLATRSYVDDSSYTPGSGLSVTSGEISVDNTVVRTSGNQTIAGEKTFSSALALSAGASGVRKTQTDGYNYISGSTAVGAGANVVLYGENYASTPNEGLLRHGSTSVAKWNTTGFHVDKSSNVVLNDGSSSKISSIVSITQAEYDGLAEKDEATLYVVTG
ncbi:MAG TPA: hypothetical protein VK054_01570 [Beutenbergiaceae bacterium]|nr:hypothetical protein [Beutenbergiaceae bacterium]